MMRSMSRWLGGTVGAALVLMAITASAQVIGTFRWQFAPYCNVVTLRVEQKGTLFELTGTDDQCGADVAAAASGTAHVNPNGTVGLALSVVRPDGLTLVSSATLSLATISGAWSDDSANSGTFVFSPPSPVGGQLRPLTLTGMFLLTFQAPGVNAEQSGSISFGRILPAKPHWHGDSNVIADGGAATANCPGSFEAPKAAPGELCLYESFRTNISSAKLADIEGNLIAVDRTGAFLFVTSAGAGPVGWLGRWAVTIP